MPDIDLIVLYVFNSEIITERHGDTKMLRRF